MGAQAVRLSNIDIDQALSNRDFEVLFQPIFDLGNGALSRMETFVRWRHASLGVLPPGAFISFFESQGRMSELSRYVLDEAMTHYLKWRGNYGPGFSINLALSDLSDEVIASHLTVLLRKHDFPADAVTLECPMPPVTMDRDHALEQFETLRKTGARLAIEVRGRANEFLRNVEPFPFDEIKTGGAAILRFARTVRGPGLSAISELLDIANDSNASITAVGVEDQASLSALRGLGFSAAQGNHLSKVGDLTDFRPVMVNHVRQLLDLDDLSSAQLSDLFRTGKPAALRSAQPEPEVSNQTQEPRDEKVTPEASSEVTEKKSVSTVERARRKAAILAKKKGKDALRNELAARRSKLGLSNTKIDDEPTPSAAKELQNLLSDNFEDSPTKANETDASTSREDISANSEAPSKKQERATGSDNSKLNSDQDKDLTNAVSDAAESVATDNVLKKTDEHTPTETENANVSTAKPSANLASIGGDPLDGRVAHIISEDAQSATINNDNLASSLTPSPREENLETPRKSDGKPVFQVKSSPTKVAAYFCNTYSAPTDYMVAEPFHESNQFVTVDSNEIYDPELERKRKIEESLVLFSLDDPQPSKPRPAPQQRPDSIATNSTTPVNAPTASVSPQEMPIRAATPLPQSFPKRSEGESDLIHPAHDIGDLEIVDTEASMIAHSASIDPTSRKHNNRRVKSENFLTRRYRLWPDHFWPRSWVRAWNRTQANKEFVRKAKLAADKLNNPDSEPRDSLF